MKKPFPLLKKASVYALTSIREGFPNALVEAMALGVPSVASDCMTGPGEIIRTKDGDAGVLLPVFSERKDLDAASIPEEDARLADEILKRNAMIDSFFDEKGRMKPLEGWPELRFFGYGRVTKAQVKVNGSLGAVLSAPFGWDVKYLMENNILPGAVRKEMTIARAKANPTLADFKADAGAWKGLKWEELAGMQMEKVNTKTRFKAVYDDENLYVAIETTLDDAIKIEPQGRDGVAFRFDDIEAMFDPTGVHERYYQLIWNPVPNSTNDGACGLIEDPLDPKYGKMDMTWNGDWSYENDRENGIWRTMLILPFKTVGAKTPAPGEVWTMKIGRSHDYNFFSGNAERSLWNPNLESISFIAPEAYGKVVFE